MTILAFGASTSSKSINQQFAAWAAHQFDGKVHLIDLNDFEMPLYSADKEEIDGIPDEAEELLEIIEKADLLVISMAEHNGSYTAAFKNTLDWCSRAKSGVFQNKPMFLLATSPGGLGAKFVLETALSRFPRHDANILGHFSLPKFGENFNNGISNAELKAAFEAELAAVKAKL
jgi:chromate reductase